VIPRDIYVTWKNKDPETWPKWMREYLNGWQTLNPGYRFHLFDDRDCEELFAAERQGVMDELGIDIVDLHHRLDKQVEKTDLWRYVTIYTRGGLYTDADTACLEPCDHWIREDDRALVGFERFRCDHPTQYCQWTFAAEPRHPFLALVLQHVSASILKVKGSDRYATLSRTGPVVFTDALIEFVEKGGHSFKAVMDKDAVVSHGLRLLRKKAFSGGHVYHRFAGTWKHWIHRPSFMWRKIHAGSSKPKHQRS